MIINNKMYKRIDKKISLANLKIKPMAYIYIRLIASVGVFLMFLVSNRLGYIFGPIAGIVFYLLFEYLTLDRSIIDRMEILEKDALEFFPIFVVIYKNGKSVKNAIEKCLEIVNNDLSKEFQLVLDNVNLGKSLDESLLNMNKRIPSIMVNNIITDLTESNRLGNNISDSINLQLGLINEKRKKNYLTDLRVIPFRITIVFIIFVLLLLGLLVLFSLM
ncbi:MAG: type II secretion system F family protein [Bacilli bacterium]|nr:type II secretion system F family protein [Bacilli bacterium]